MMGAITTWDIFSHPISTIRCFGWRTFFRAMLPKHGRTFLSLLEQDGYFRPAASPASTILDRCIALELQAKRAYEILAAAFDGQGAAGQIFTGLAVQEQYHVELLQVCRAAAVRNGWKIKLFNPWQDYLPPLEEQMHAAVAAAREVSTIDDALQLVIRIESSEINVVFQTAVAATDSDFVKRLKPFQEAMEAQHGPHCRAAPRTVSAFADGLP